MFVYKEEFRRLVPSKKYNVETSASLAIACDLAYRKNRYIQSIVKDWGYSQVAFVDVKKGADIDTQAFIMSDEKNIVIVFRGSDDLRDWFANFQAVRDPGPLENSKVHEGFQDALYPAVL